MRHVRGQTIIQRSGKEKFNYNATNMDPYKRLALTEEQKEVLDELVRVCKRATEVKLCFVEALDVGCFAYNAKNVDCFNAPSNAAYDNEKEQVDITKLQRALHRGILNCEYLLDETKCLVAFTDEAYEELG